MLPQKAIEDLKETYRKEFRQELSDKEACEMAYRLLSFFEIVLRPVPQDSEKKGPGKSEGAGQLPLFS